MDRKNDTAPLNRKCDHCLRSSVRVHFVSARPEVRRFLLAKRILYIHYVFLPLFSREQYGPFPCRLRLVFVSSPCLSGRWMLFIYYLPMTAFVRANATQKPFCCNWRSIFLTPLSVKPVIFCNSARVILGFSLMAIIIFWSLISLYMRVSACVRNRLQSY